MQYHWYSKIKFSFSSDTKIYNWFRLDIKISVMEANWKQVSCPLEVPFSYHFAALHPVEALSRDIPSGEGPFVEEFYQCVTYGFYTAPWRQSSSTPPSVSSSCSSFPSASSSPPTPPPSPPLPVPFCEVSRSGVGDRCAAEAVGVKRFSVVPLCIVCFQKLRSSSQPT
ncbi:hypothetical protein CDAR_594461 [Caerostris darwini]|uniref:Uncharacterized protein n=1 Tax=Caerostris darwini TaxID=1538125 RepID=A0AAV4VW41_9ARAC|nr:hypothetical protein CDAR_594461 [Caerostris darwini]